VCFEKLAEGVNVLALNRKRKHNDPVRCSFCGEKRAHHTLHGLSRFGGGRTCCDVCFPGVKSEYVKEQEREAAYEMTEADYQTWGKL
jgi:hypothetical protein